MIDGGSWLGWSEPWGLVGAWGRIRQTPSAVRQTPSAVRRMMSPGRVTQSTQTCDRQTVTHGIPRPEAAELVQQDVLVCR